MLSSQCILFIKNGTYTIANSLSCFLRLHPKIQFAHYNKLHPLDDFLIIQLSLYDRKFDYIEIFTRNFRKNEINI